MLGKGLICAKSVLFDFFAENKIIFSGETTFKKTNYIFGEVIVQSESREEQERLEVKERDNMYVVEVELPGYDRENIQILFNDGYLVVTAGEEFKKAYYIGRNVLQDNICASFYNGILKCMLTKSEREYEDGPVEVNIL